jgi:hypothetical protein
VGRWSPRALERAADLWRAGGLGRSGRRRARFGVLALTVSVGIGVGAVTAIHEPADARDTVPTTTIHPVAGDSGRVFDGIGAVSGGGNTSRLLMDYPAKQRAQILDYLFRPDYGANLQMLKVEIGADTDSTEGAEPSIERAPGVIDCNRGYEWTIIQEARARNPHLRLAALEWGAPGWLHGGFWSQDNIHYLLDWLGCARQHGLTIDYLGGWNERGYKSGWFANLAVAVHRVSPTTKIVAADSFDWHIADAMRRDPSFGKAVAVIGMHHPCKPEWKIARCVTPSSARTMPQPLWASEESAQDFDGGAQPLARELNRNYLDGRMTGAFVWSAVAAFYDDLPLAGRGLMLAESPWSGSYQVGKDVWVVAHTTQFVSPGWRYLDHASGALRGGGTIATLRAPGRPTADGALDWSSIIETTSAHRPQQITIVPGAGLRRGTAHTWCTDLNASNPRRWFVRQADRPLDPHGVTLTMPPGSLCSVTTTTGQGRGNAASPRPASLPLPYTADLSGATGSNPPLFFDVNGAFETVPCAPGATGPTRLAGALSADGDAGGTGCVAQVVDRKPIAWSSAGDGDPTTVFGDPTWDGDYTVSASVLLQSAPWADVIGRVDSARGRAVGGYHLRLAKDGSWKLLAEGAILPAHKHDIGQGVSLDRVLASGRVRIPAGWQRVALQMTGEHITALINGVDVASVNDMQHTRGQVGFIVGGWRPAEFSDVTVVPTAAAPATVPASDLSVTASSQTYDSAFNLDGRPGRVLDGRPSTLWTSLATPSPGRPQSLTVKLHQPRRISAITVTPRADGSVAGMIEGYLVEVSVDGTHYREVAAGMWQPGTATHIVQLPQLPALHDIRFVATSTISGPATVAELALLPKA